MNDFFNSGNMLYSAFLQEKPVAVVPCGCVDIAQAVVKKLNWATQIRGQAVAFNVKPIPENDRVMIALSGGLDSVYFMHKLKDAGYDVTAVHVNGLNKSSAAVEAEEAKKIADAAGVKFINANYKAPKQVFPDNPF